MSATSAQPVDLIQDLESVAEEALADWDGGERAVMLLAALAGRADCYDPRVTRVRHALSVIDRFGTPTDLQ